jgi:hypothetical protein
VNHEIALGIANNALKDLRKLSYEECRDMIQLGSKTMEIVGSDGKRYQVQTEAFWDSKKNGPIRVMVLVDDGGLAAFKPLARDFIIAPDGSFVGETGTH